VVNIPEKMIPELPREEFMAQFVEESHGAIDDAVKKTGATHVINMENLAFDSSEFGMRTALVVGPMCSIKSVQEALDNHVRLGDVPSRFQYPKNFMEVSDVSE